MNLYRPESVDELRQILQQSASVQIVGRSSELSSELGATARIEMCGFNGMVDFHPDDLTCSVRAGTSMEDLQTVLREKHLCLPAETTESTVGGAYMGHIGPGGWRDWVIGATFMLADGMIAKSGSHAVKSVAGYDVHRFMAGTRGTLAICLELVLRVFPTGVSQVGRRQTASPPEIVDPTQIKLMKRAKSIFDPSNKLNPGEMGIF